MKTLVMYYSFGGTSRKEAERIAESIEGASICEVKEAKKRTMLSAFFSGCPKALKREASKIEPVSCEPGEFDHVMLVAPVWAGFPVPAFNAMVGTIPAGKKVEVYLCSAGGETPKSKEGTITMLEDKGFEVVAYHDVKASSSK